MTKAHACAGFDSGLGIKFFSFVHLIVLMRHPPNTPNVTSDYPLVLGLLRSLKLVRLHFVANYLEIS